MKGETNTLGAIIDLKTLNSSTRARLVLNTTALYIGTETNHPYLFLTNATEKMRLTESGYLGLNSTPDGTCWFQVKGNTGVLDNVAKLFGGDSSTASYRGTLALQHNTDVTIASGSGLAITFAPLSHTGGGYVGLAKISGVRENATANNQDTALSFLTRSGASNSTTDTEKMRISSTGKVMIGTATPNGMLIADDGSGVKYSVLTKDANIGSQFYGAYSTAHVRMTYPAVADWDLLANSAGAFTIGNGTERVRITSAGLVGIGKTPSFALDILMSSARIAVATGDTTASQIQFINSGGNLYFGIDDTSGGGFGVGSYARVIYSGGAYPLAIFTNDAERINVSSAGVTTFKKAARASETALTSSGASIAIDLSANNDFTHTMTENTTLAAPSNAVVGQSGSIRITQHASAPKTLAYNTAWKFAGGTIPTLTATNGAFDTLYYYVRSASVIECSLIKAFA